MRGFLFRVYLEPFLNSAILSIRKLFMGFINLKIQLIKKRYQYSNTNYR